jgi:curved DNA-binding protein CbpA
VQEVFLSEAQKRTPKPSPARLDAKNFPLSPTDGYVLSRIDGTLNEADLTASTGLPDEQVKVSLAKLEALGLIVFDGAPAPTAPLSGTAPIAGRTSSVQIRTAAAASSIPSRPNVAPPPPASRPNVAPPPISRPNVVSPVAAPPPISRPNVVRPVAAAASTSAMTAAPIASAPPKAAAAGQLTAEEQAMLDEDVDLEPELRRRVLDAHRDLDRKDYYALLGIEESADRKGIKRAYYELAAAFHPDRYFRKRLGSFKGRMEAVFAKLTLAHDALSDKQRRGEYNAYLSEQRIAHAIEENLARGATQAVLAEESVARAVKADVAVSSPPAAPTGSAAPPPPPAFDPLLAPKVDVGARRDTLARRLLGGRPPSASAVRTAAPVNPTPQPMPAADAVAALKRRYEERMALAKTSEARKFAGQGDASVAAGDLVAAANAYRIASNLTPEDADLAKKYGVAKAKADTLLSETYTKQAHYEENNNQWTEAARSWARVCKSAPDDANAHERGAHAILKSSGDLHEGVRFGQRAVELQPENAHYRITLANCYIAAGLGLNAKRELDTAAQLAPHDDTIQAIIKRVGQPASPKS